MPCAASFPILDCEREITGKDARPCLYYHIKLCGGPCIGAQIRDEYRATVRQLMGFLEGDADKVLKQIEEQMGRAAENLQFELAAIYRDRLQAAQRIAEQQKIVSTAQEDADYIALAQDPRTRRDGRPGLHGAPWSPDGPRQLSARRR